MFFLRFKIVSFLLLFVVIIACNDDKNPMTGGNEMGEKAYVLNSIGISLSVIDLDSLTVENDAVQLGATGSPVGFSVRNGTAIVPTGTGNSLVVLDLGTLQITGTVELPDSSGATGSAFLDDSTAFVCNLNLNTVSRVNLNRMTVVQTAPVGVLPSDVEVVDGKVFVANANLVNWAPAGNGTISVLNPQTMQVTRTIDAKGTNTQFLAVDPDGELIVVNSGSIGLGDGSVLAIDPLTETVTAGPIAIGEYPGQHTVSNDGIAYLPSFSFGLYAFDTSSNTILRDENNALAATTSGGQNIGAGAVAVAENGYIYSVNFGDAVSPGTVYVFDASETLVDSVKVGFGPIAIHID